MWRLIILLLCLPTLVAAAPRSAVFFHPDGMGVNTWQAVRLFSVGADGRLAWDKLPQLAVYTGHMQDQLVGTSHGGGTIHAYGAKVLAQSYGLNGEKRVEKNGQPALSLAVRARNLGKAIGVINSGSLTEPGTGAFIASVPARDNHCLITAQLLDFMPDVLLGGGEKYFLPTGTSGRFGEGACAGGRNLINEATSKGYTIVYTAAELAAVPAGTKKLLGIFAHDHTFNDKNETTLATQNLPLYNPDAPSIAAMIEATLQHLQTSPQGFLLLAEEEGTDNFGNVNNAIGVLTAGARADAALAVLVAAAQANPDLAVLTTSDSDAGGMQVWVGRGLDYQQPTPAREPNGAPLDGVTGEASAWFIAPADARGVRLPFAIAWAGLDDVAGGILVRAINLPPLPTVVDNSAIADILFNHLAAPAPSSAGDKPPIIP